MRRKTKPEGLYPHLGRIMKKRRSELDLTQQEVAEQLGFDASTIAYYEQGASRMRLLEFVQVCQVLKLDPGTLLRQMMTADPVLFIPCQEGSISNHRNKTEEQG